MKTDNASDSHVGGGIVGSREGIAAVARKAIVEVVAVLVGIAAYRGINRPSRAVIHDSGNPPIVEEAAQHLVAAMEGPWFGRESHDQALALVGDARSALGAGNVRVLHRCRLAGDQGVLPVVD